MLDGAAGPNGFCAILLAVFLGVSVPICIILGVKFPKTGNLQMSRQSLRTIKSNPANYRPVSLTSVICKVVEQISKDYLAKHFEEAKVMSNCQHDFMVINPVWQICWDTFECWTIALDGGYGIDILHLDYRKAFGTVAHEELLEILKEYGINGMVLQWSGSKLPVCT
jgi:Reverse transcriptase (RNA-dependent DNA polymerase)